MKVVQTVSRTESEITRADIQDVSRKLTRRVNTGHNFTFVVFSAHSVLFVVRVQCGPLGNYTSSSDSSKLQSHTLPLNLNLSLLSYSSYAKTLNYSLAQLRMSFMSNCLQVDDLS